MTAGKLLRPLRKIPVIARIQTFGEKYSLNSNISQAFAAEPPTKENKRKMSLWIAIKNERKLAKYTENLGENILLARGFDNDHLLIGYIKVDEGLAYFALDGRVICKKEFSMFVIYGSRYFSWHYHREGEYWPPKSFLAGYDNSNRPTFIGKTAVNGEELFGRVNVFDEPVLSIATKSDGVVFAYSFYILLE